MYLQYLLLIPVSVFGSLLSTGPYCLFLFSNAVRGMWHFLVSKAILDEFILSLALSFVPFVVGGILKVSVDSDENKNVQEPYSPTDFSF